MDLIDQQISTQSEEIDHIIRGEKGIIQTNSTLSITLVRKVQEA